MFSYVTLEQRVPREHPLREIRKLTDEVLRSLSAEFDGLYSDLGRRSIAPEYVLRALLLQVFFSVRSERQLVEQIDYNLLFRWFVGLGMTTWCGTMPCSEEPRPSAHVGGGAALLRRGERAGKAVHVGRSFPADGTLIGMGLAQELPLEVQLGR